MTDGEYEQLIATLQDRANTATERAAAAPGEDRTNLLAEADAANQLMLEMIAERRRSRRQRSEHAALRGE